MALGDQHRHLNLAAREAANQEGQDFGESVAKEAQVREAMPLFQRELARLEEALAIFGW